MADSGDEFSEIPKLLYQKIVQHCIQHRSEVQGSQEIYIAAFEAYTQQLIDEEKFDETFECFADALDLYPEDAEILNVLGVTLNRLRKPLESIEYFEKALRLSPWNLKIKENRENVINEWIPRWHFPMLNDTNRNLKYKNALETKISEGFSRVLDIGTGTGLLSLYACLLGAAKVYACEVNELMLNTAERVIAENRCESKIKLIPRYSTNLTVDEHLDGSPVDLIVTEIFDCGAFGEGVLKTLIHAKENLLHDNGRIIPEGVKIYVAGVNKVHLQEKQDALNSTFENSIYLKDAYLEPIGDGPYEPLTQVNSDMQIIAEYSLALSVDFNSLENLKDAITGKMDKEVQLSCSNDGILEGFLVFFELFLDDKNILKNFDAENRQPTCWDPILFPLKHTMEVRKYQVLKVNMSCRDGVLALNHKYDDDKHRHVQIDPEVYAFLTDDEYIYELEFNVQKVLKKHSATKQLKIADFSPFPHIGINFLKENKVERLFCLARIREFVETVADLNCISKNLIDFIDDFDSFDAKCDLIILQPITSYGTLNSNQLKFYEKFKSDHLTPNGSIFPHKIDICGKLIYSEWLDRVSKVRNDELAALGIEKFMNRYATRNQFEFLADSESLALSQVFTISTVQFTIADVENAGGGGDSAISYTKNVVVNLNLPEQTNKINGIYYFYRIFFTNSSMPLLTNRVKSYCKQNCFVRTLNVVEKSCVMLNYRQYEFSFECKLKEFVN